MSTGFELASLQFMLMQTNWPRLIKRSANLISMQTPPPTPIGSIERWRGLIGAPWSRPQPSHPCPPPLQPTPRPKLCAPLGVSDSVIKERGRLLGGVTRKKFAHALFAVFSPRAYRLNISQAHTAPLLFASLQRVSLPLLAALAF